MARTESHRAALCCTWPCCYTGLRCTGLCGLHWVTVAQAQGRAVSHLATPSHKSAPYCTGPRGLRRVASGHAMSHQAVFVKTRHQRLCGCFVCQPFCASAHGHAAFAKSHQAMPCHTWSSHVSPGCIKSHVVYKHGSHYLGSHFILRFAEFGSYFGSQISSSQVRGSQFPNYNCPLLLLVIVKIKFRKCHQYSFNCIVANSATLIVCTCLPFPFSSLSEQRL